MSLRGKCLTGEKDDHTYTHSQTNNFNQLQSRLNLNNHVRKQNTTNRDSKHGGRGAGSKHKVWTKWECSLLVYCWVRLLNLVNCGFGFANKPTCPKVCGGTKEDNEGGNWCATSDTFDKGLFKELLPANKRFRAKPVVSYIFEWVESTVKIVWLALNIVDSNS